MQASIPGSEENSPAPRRRRPRTKLALVGALALLALFGARRYGNWQTDLERDAMDFVRINGFTNEGYKHNLKHPKIVTNSGQCESVAF